VAVVASANGARGNAGHAGTGGERETLYRYLLVKNAELRELHLAIGPEDGIYLMAQIPILEVTTERLDEVVGATLTYVEEIYPTAMTMGLASLYRRRKKS